MVFSSFAAAQRDLPASHSADFRNRRWVRNVLPLATSLLLHVALIVLGLTAYQVVKQVNNPNREQTVIPDSAAIQPAQLPMFQHAGLFPLDDTRKATQDLDRFTPLDGLDLKRQGGFETGPDSADLTGVGPNSARPGGVPGNAFDPGKGVAPFAAPRGDGGGPMMPNLIPDHANRVVFLCDASGSMLGVFGRLKQELKETINQLDVSDGQEFNLIFFSDGKPTALFADGTHPATPQEKKRALDFIDNVVASGGTEPLPAIKMAMGEKPELIYLLTDGFDQIASFDEVTAAFRDGNRDGHIHVDCVFLQADQDPKLEQVLQQIADDSHGRFRKILKSDM